MNAFCRFTRQTTALAALFLILLVSGCLRSPETRFYMLSSPAAVMPPEQALSGAAVQGPRVVVSTTISAYIDRPQIVTRRSNGVDVQILDFQQWSDPMADGITRVLCDVLSARLAPVQGLAFPLASALPPDWQFTVYVARFDGAPNEEAVLDVLWSLTPANESESVASGRFVSHAKVGVDMTALAIAESELISRLGESLAAELHKVIRSSPKAAARKGK